MHCDVEKHAPTSPDSFPPPKTSPEFDVPRFGGIQPASGMHEAVLLALPHCPLTRVETAYVNIAGLERLIITLLEYSSNQCLSRKCDFVSMFVVFWFFFVSLPIKFRVARCTR